MTRITLIGRVALVAAAMALIALLVTSPAQARKVANPGPVTFTFASGELKVGDETFDAADPDDAITFQGSVAENGAVVIPQSNIRFPEITFEVDIAGTIRVNIRPVGDATGVVNPLTGVSTLQVRFYIDIDGNLVGDNCRVGTPGSPITLNLTSETSGGQTGVRYNPANGTVTLVDGLFAVPGASGCSTFPINVNNEINSQLGLPSPSGRNYARLSAVLNPVVQPGVTSAFTANPASGPAPLSSTFTGSGTGRGTLSYQWDFTNNGSFDASGQTVSATYTTPGTYTARLRVTDADGDFSETTRQIVVAVPRPDASLQVTQDPGLGVTGQPRGFTLDVQNVGSLDASGITASAVFPAGMPFTGYSGTDWTCVAGTPVTCSYAGTLGIGQSAPPLRLEGTPDGSVIGTVTTDFAVNAPDDQNPSNNTAQETTQIIQGGVDLNVLKRHDAEDGLFRGERATYTIDVDNRGTTTADQRIRIVDDLPEGVSYRSASGPGWTCSYTAPRVACFSDADLAPGEALPTLRITVDVLPGAPSALDNTATVSVDGDGNPANNSSTDRGFVSGLAVDYVVDLSHSGDFLAGEAGTYRIVVHNDGPKTGGAQVAVNAALPEGLVPTAAGGASPDDPDAADWICSVVGQAVMCAHPGPVEAGGTLETINVTVDVRDEAIGTQTATANVVSDDDPEGGSDADETLVRSPRPDLALDKSHGDARFSVGGQGTYALEVTNTAAEPSRGAITLTDTLPTGLTYVSATGTDWSCGAAGQVVTCTRSTPIRGGQSSTVSLTVAVGAAAAPGVTNVATVATANDTQPGNDTDADPTSVDVPLVATSIRAEGAVATIDLIRVRIGLDGVRATLKTSTGTPIPGRRLDFRTANGTMICSGVTDGGGTARCGTVLLTMLQAALGSNYTATFAGDETYAPSQGKGPLVLVGAIRLG